MIRVLQVYPQLNNAGTEMVIMNLYKNIEKNKVQFDFLVEKKGELDDIIRNMGGRIYYLKSPNKKLYYKALNSFFHEHKEYSIVHTHTHRNMGYVLKAAKKNGVTIRIAHSHNARVNLPKIVYLYKKITSRIIEKNATDFFACSSIAAKWLFPHKYSQAKIVYNAIELEKFYFQTSSRQKIRDELGLNENHKLICHVGRFAKQKNHNKIIDIANELLKNHDDTFFALVGEGPLLVEIKDKAKRLNIEDKIFFLGNRTDVNSIMSASDLFLFPSLHEGLGIVLIEAQTSGLDCITSEMVPSEADLKLGLFTKKKLSDNVLEWVNTINGKLIKKNNRNNFSKRAILSNYDISKVATKVQKFYEKGVW